ncbi:lysM and putative peptidoglycan-binding domain-containing protein 1 [Passer montanus]|uniref:lysM and putative peptidoglycan-binding domain-containing protein 1 n=1 Tax=Passer montanus TaxID=9160 RepID=UPI00195F5B2D|nr:lysM and putative peptidoglycan-binding domain-containing protein 1 [Passer montanus]
MEQIQRANRLYSSDTIFLRATLLIPGHGEPPGDSPGDSPGDITGDITGDSPGDRDSPRDGPRDGPGPSRRDLSASDFLRRLDAEIGRCKEAARGLRGPGSPGGGPSPALSPRGARLGPRPLTRTPRAAALRDSEDEIFTL